MQNSKPVHGEKMTIYKRMSNRLKRSGYDISESQIRRIVSVIFQVIAWEMICGRSVTIRRFGKFYPVAKKTRRLASNLTGKMHILRWRRVTRFYACKKLRRMQ